MAPIYFVIVAFPCMAGAIALAIFHIYRHLLNYTEPTYQRYIVRIIFMVPKSGEILPRQLDPKHIMGCICLSFRGAATTSAVVYALMSFLSLVLNESSIYFNSIREVYEAWVIYNFLSLCLAWVGGPGAVVLSLSGRVLKPSWYLMTCCFPAIPLDGRFIRRCKQGCLQFVILKPILVAVTFIFYAKGKYEDGNFSAKQAYLYVTIIYTISYTTALYALALFYVACRDLLRPFHPVPKFIMIKSVVFLTYWQGVLVFLAAKSSFIKNAEEAAELQNFIICVEMLIAAVGHLYAFPHKEYAGANIGASGGLTGSLAHALKFNDFYHDAVHQFAPTYHDYVLYNHTEGDEGTRKYRSRTFVPTGQEMDTVRRNKHMLMNRIDDIQLSSVSSSGNSTPKNPGAVQDSSDPEAMKSSLLMDGSNAFARTYDLSLIDMDLSSYSSKVPAANDFGTR
ncbi:transmembrane protein 184A-like isoform X2 [Macadamia integrifolia]|uniref:transmembrane protein 184A-like isoform X2 n=1 Tax=Macadamia integrifolia TaxID=60698 RepID=UPI001C531756|nr:transmembrane protein 184A-like isoform X2 [Macadamia integrifolia]